MTILNGYGTVVHFAAVDSLVNKTRTSDDQDQPLLGAPKRKSDWRKNMMVNVHRDWADVILLMCYTITGLLDSASISTWGSFVSMQTGRF